MPPSKVESAAPPCRQSLPPAANNAESRANIESGWMSMAPATDAQTGELLNRYLADRDVLCPGCGYNLRDLTRDHCPECDQGLALRVGLVESGLAGFIAGLIGLAAGAGFSGLLLLFFV